MKRNKAKKKILATVVAFVLLIACAVGATFAWFTDVTEVIENTFTVGNVEIALIECDDDKDMIGHFKISKAEAAQMTADYQKYLNGYTDDGGIYHPGAGENIVPGTKINKYVCVTNCGANDAVVRVKVCVPSVISDYLTLEYNSYECVQTVERDVETVNIRTPAGYTGYTGTWDVYTYTYKYVLWKDSFTGESLTSVTLKPETTQTQMNTALTAINGDTDPADGWADSNQFGIIVYAEAVQAENLVDTSKNGDALLADINAAFVAGFGG